MCECDKYLQRADTFAIIFLSAIKRDKFQSSSINIARLAYLCVLSILSWSAVLDKRPNFSNNGARLIKFGTFDEG